MNLMDILNFMELFKFCLILASVGLSVASLVVSRQATRYARQAENAIKRINSTNVK